MPCAFLSVSRLKSQSFGAHLPSSVLIISSSTFNLDSTISSPLTKSFSRTPSHWDQHCQRESSAGFELSSEWSTRDPNTQLEGIIVLRKLKEDRSTRHWLTLPSLLLIRGNASLDMPWHQSLTRSIKVHFYKPLYPKTQYSHFETSKKFRRRRGPQEEIILAKNRSLKRSGSYRSSITGSFCSLAFQPGGEGELWNTKKTANHETIHTNSSITRAASFHSPFPRLR